MSAGWVQRIGDRVLPLLRSIADDIAREHPDVKVHVWDGPVGSLTELQGHDFGVECLFRDRTADESDNVALSINLAHLTTQPKLTSLDVCWGHPSGRLELDVLADWIDLDDAALERIVAELPRLASALKSAVGRGRPR
jgi:hypothetical protein